MAKTIKNIKSLEWDHITLTRNGFRGAIKEYESTNGGKVAVMFNETEAFIIRDEQGLFETRDLVSGIVKAKDIDIESTGTIEGLEGVAWYDNDENVVGFDDAKLTELGINDSAVRLSIQERLIALSALSVYVDMEL